LLCLMVLAAATSAWITRHGPGFEGNSVPYVSAARTFAQTGVMLVPDDKGQMGRLVLWPPLYPATMGALSKVFGDALPAGRWLNVGLFPLNILLLALLGWQLGLAKRPLALVCLLFTFAPVTLYAHINLMSESLCLFWWLGTLNGLLVYHRRQTWPILVSVALLAALTWLSRFIAIATIASGALFVLGCTQGTWHRRVWRGGAFGLMAVAPLEIWTHFLSGVTIIGTRKLSYYGLAKHQIDQILRAWLRWVVPFDQMAAVKVAAIAVFVVWLGFLVLKIYRHRDSIFAAGADGGAISQAGLILIALNFAAVEGVIFCTALFLDVTLDMGERMHYFAFVFVLLLLGAMGSALVRGALATSGPPARKFAAAVPILILAGYFAGGALWLSQADSVHLNYNARAWRESPALAALAQKYSDTLIYTNHIGAIYLHTGRTDARLVPLSLDKTRPMAMADFEDSFANMLRETTAHHGLIVYFRETYDRAPLESVEKDPRLKVLETFPDAVFFVPAGK